MDKSLIAALLLFPLVALGQTHTFPGNNVFPSTSTTDFNAGATVDFTGATVTGLAGGGAVTSVFTRTGAVVAATNDYTFAQIGSKPTTIVGYGITDAFTQTAADLLYAPVIHAHTFASLTGKPTTFSGYSISDTSANLRTAVTDENGTGALLFNGATTPNFVTGITIGGAAASGTVLQGDGTKFAPSAAAFPVGLPVSDGKIMQAASSNWVSSTPSWPTTAGTAGYTMRSDGTNVFSYPQVMLNSATAATQALSTTDLYLPGSAIVVATGDFKAKGQYRCVFDVVKSAGTGTIAITLRVGTTGTAGSDPTILTFNCPGAGTSVADTGTFEIIATWKSVGSGTSAVMQGICRAQKNTITAAGLWNTTTSALTIVSSASAAFNSSTGTTIGICFNGGTAFSGTNTMVQATLTQ